MKATKLKSGNWNVRVYVGKDANGNSITRSVTAPTRKEAIEKAVEVERKAKGVSLTVSQSVEKFLSEKQKVLSPNTFRCYVSMFRNNIANDPLSVIPASIVNDTHIQLWINRLIDKGLGPKSIRNNYALIMSSLSRSFSVKLPQRRQPRLHTPSTEEVAKVVEMARPNRDLYRAILLGAVGMMRRGEIAALTADDFDFTRNTVTIDKAMALDSNNIYTVKPPKNDSSNRTIVLPKFVMDEMPRSGPVISCTANSITLAFGKLIKKAGVTPFRFHDLRHYAASIAASSSVGASVESIKARGGWATDAMMKRVYINKIGAEIDKDTASINDYYGRFLPTQRPLFVSPLCNLFFKYTRRTYKIGTRLKCEKPLRCNKKHAFSVKLTLVLKSAE